MGVQPKADRELAKVVRRLDALEASVATLGASVARLNELVSRLMVASNVSDRMGRSRV